ncbi:TrmH family RNA methyltransferase [Nodosilinea sp. LEGE 07088]|uniref:TrmH family RNA methyltransferase n=1 Tax=Nodosilinea sp. LEGE 07088 TaxID=2777968 RepID=UPI00187F156B|nr:TrmH family RNA methyltransferase [Nodosilinea sp. LEGE 07088]MBE9137246.1 TrmH family RNA methyltransferase [Nodosilinea sp. LEGE 07088]
MTSLRRDYQNLPRHSLVVCAALVENPMNLGMLCRTAEAFRLEALVLRDLTLASDRTFRQGAVATYQWQPLWECPTPALLQWLAERRDQGYSPIALDLQPNAMPLSQMQFAQRTVLVLGRELTGLPAEVSAACDQTVAISQYGMVPSLNVQTAAALAIYAYICQWGMAPPPLK